MNLTEELKQLRTWLVEKGGLTLSDTNTLVELLTRTTGESGDYLSRQGDTAPVIAYLAKGLIKGSYTNLEGKEFVKDFYAEGEVAANYAEAINGRPVEMALRFVEPSVVYQMDSTKFRMLFGSSPCWSNLGRVLVEKYFLNRDSRERLLLVEDAKGRYESFLKQNGHLINRIRNYDLASYLAIDPATLSRIKRAHI